MLKENGLDELMQMTFLSHKDEKQLATADDNPNLILIGSAHYEILPNLRYGKEFNYPSNSEKLKKRLYKMQPFFAHSSAFFLKEAFHKVGGYRKEFIRSQDWDLWLRMVDLGEFKCLKEPLVGIRTYHKGRLTNTDNGRTQMLYSRVAVASYWMREIYNYDPVDISSEEFSKFKTHLEKEIN